jgi:hypothetical protein
MRKTIRFLVGAVAVLGILALLLSDCARAALNCNTTQCVAISYQKTSNTNLTNTSCYMTYVQPAGQPAGYVGYAYSTAYAFDKGYGQDSIKGTAGGNATGYWLPCNGNPDCNVVGLTPISGSTGAVTGKAFTPPGGYNNKCNPAGG